MMYVPSVSKKYGVAPGGGTHLKSDGYVPTSVSN